MINYDLIEIQAQQLVFNQLIITLIVLSGPENAEWIFQQLDSFVQRHADSLNKKDEITDDDQALLDALRTHVSVLKQKIQLP